MARWLSKVFPDLNQVAKPSSTAEPATSAKASGSQGLAGGAMLPYLVGACLAAAAMAWYFFWFVPYQLDYFVGAKFRTLAVADEVLALRGGVDHAASGVVGSVPQSEPDRRHRRRLDTANVPKVVTYDFDCHSLIRSSSTKRGPVLSH